MIQPETAVLETAQRVRKTAGNARDFDGKLLALMVVAGGQPC
jgi:hypothetical protein